MKFKYGKVYIHYCFAGVIEKVEDRYLFTYDQEYLKNNNAQPVSLTLPLQLESYKSKILFPFFDGLIPEGWLLELTIKNWKLKSNDRWALLLTVCTDCIGAVHVIGET